MIRLTEEQEQEHRVVKEALKILEGIGARFERDEEVEPQVIETQVFHHYKTPLQFWTLNFNRAKLQRENTQFTIVDSRGFRAPVLTWV
mgnify:CR=1 FL=1